MKNVIKEYRKYVSKSNGENLEQHIKRAETWGVGFQACEHDALTFYVVVLIWGGSTLQSQLILTQRAFTTVKGSTGWT